MTGVQPRIDQLGGYLDIVETQLMREIACRSRAMFEAAGELHDLHRTLCQTLDQIKVSMDRHEVRSIEECGPNEARRLILHRFSGRMPQISWAKVKMHHFHDIFPVSYHQQ